MHDNSDYFRNCLAQFSSLFSAFELIAAAILIESIKPTPMRNRDKWAFCNHSQWNDVLQLCDNCGCRKYDLIAQAHKLN